MGKEIFFSAYPGAVMGKKIIAISCGITLPGEGEVAKQMQVSLIPDDK